VVAAPIVLHVSTSDGWAHAAAILTGIAALATGILAYFTWRLASETKNVAEKTHDEAVAVTEQVRIANEQARIATEQVELSRQAMRAAIRPWLVPALRWTEIENSSVKAQHGLIDLREDAQGIHGSVPLRNIGPGVAVIDREKSNVLGYGGLGSDLFAYTNLKTSVPVVPSGEVAELAFTIPGNTAAWVGITLDVFTGQNHVGDFGLDVWYSDWAQEQPMRVRFLVGRDTAGAEWHVFRSEYYDGLSGELVTRVDSTSWTDS
jgi:hypothetical protein